MTKIPKEYIALRRELFRQFDGQSLRRLVRFGPLGEEISLKLTPDMSSTAISRAAVMSWLGRGLLSSGSVGNDLRDYLLDSSSNKLRMASTLALLPLYPGATASQV